MPTIIVSTGIDLTDPVDFRKLDWHTPASDIVAAVKTASTMPALHGPVTFVTVPVAGGQPQLGQAEKTYRNTTWKALLLAAGATTVTFVDPATATTATGAPTAAPVPTIGMPTTPIVAVPDPEDPPSLTCSIPGSYFVVNTAELINPEQAVKNLAPCLTKAIEAQSTYRLAGWTSYVGPLTRAGRPAIDRPENRRLSRHRIDTIARFLIDNFDIDAAAITAKDAYGNTRQPYPKAPASPRNRVVTITFTLPTS